MGNRTRAQSGARARMPELGWYGLAGHASDPRGLLDEIAAGESLGLGAVFLSERFDTKDAGVLAGVAAATSTGIGIATAATNPNTRHPVVTATLAVTAHRMSGGRYALGLGRGFDLLFDVMGLPRVTTAQLEDAIGLYRRLWCGETVVGHDGPVGTFPLLRQDPSFAEAVPVLLTAIGERSLALAGRCADGVVLHTFFTDDTLRRSVEIVRNAAADAGREPSDVRIWSVLATVPESLPEDAQLRKLTGRLATYLQGYGDVLVAANGWDRAVLARFRDDPVVRGVAGAIDAVATPDELAHVRALLPEEWLAASATGTAYACAEGIGRQLELGADSVVAHGVTPTELAPVADAWSEIRTRFPVRELPVNPGRVREHA
ncbi:TIGR03857 family LLM class F420-dependent oxidoreductase [Rhodococcus sp. HNM0569]|uniref:TIGR03857 family LLM class F420-dependent oxidoreductase n=1 Tax=Rhodococcus sp. HNM0569 TaxID=2716340 RepID=UPI00146D9625|nr:TIGR03857 family LLM class F420-dependent oxidoreductase [Rhodococcus sp. HNM0569]NLU84212.1 TIGR03857 family LLM class F420-dependent oxidoreductase [Rhodococcus sp. HNM0569]